MPPEKPPAFGISRTEQIPCCSLTPLGLSVPPWRKSNSSSNPPPTPTQCAAARSAPVQTTPCPTALTACFFNSTCNSQPMGRCSWAARPARQCAYAVKGPAPPTREPGAGVKLRKIDLEKWRKRNSHEIEDAVWHESA